MNKKSSEFVQTVLFVIIAFGQIFLAIRYYSRDDTIGMAFFITIAVLAGIAAFGHFLAWRRLSKNGRH
jgi:FtsH-binding integral membrane protein